MKIVVTLKGPLKKYFQDKKTQEFFYPDSITIEELLKFLQLSEEHVSIIAVNGVKVSLSYLLKDADEVIIYPPVSGG